MKSSDVKAINDARVYGFNKTKMKTSKEMGDVTNMLESHPSSSSLMYFSKEPNAI